MNQNIGPYQIIIENPRQSKSFLANTTQIVQYLSNTGSQIIKFQHILPGAYPQSKILNGPTIYTQIIAVFRRIPIEDKENDKIYFGLFLVDLKSPHLNFTTLLTKVLENQLNVRDIAIHPDRTKLTIFYQNKFEYYKFKIENGQYKIRLYNSNNYQKEISVFDIQYTPSGDFIIGISRDKKSNIVQLFKLNTKDNTFIFSQNVDANCLIYTRLHRLSKWALSINKNQQNIALIAAGGSKICKLNIKNMKITPFDILNTNQIKISYQHQKTYKDPKISVASSTSILNSTSLGYYTIYLPIANIAQQYILNKTGNFYQNTFRFLPGIPEQNEKIVKCIDIPDINSIACIKNFDKAQITKIDITKKVEYHLATLNPTKINVNNSEIINQEQIVQDIFYNRQASEVCLFYDLKLYCYKITTKCTNDIQNIAINQCSDVCQLNGKDMYWNPMTMQCQVAKNNVCTDKKTSYNPFFQNCTLNCKKIPLATPQSEYNLNKKCICNPPYSWYDDLKICRYNCSSVVQADLTADYTQIQPTQCQCVHGFKYITTQNIYGQKIGFCKAYCQNGKPLQFKNDLPVCQCLPNQIWDHKTFSCKSQIIQTKKLKKLKMLTIWPILLVLCILLVLGIIAIIYKKYKSKKNKKGQVPPSSDRNTVNKMFEMQLKRSQSSISNNKICYVCNNYDTNVNCVGPCGHYYHFSCIQARIDAQNYLCPECNSEFPNGLVDMKLVEKQQQVFSIAEN